MRSPFYQCQIAEQKRQRSRLLLKTPQQHLDDKSTLTPCHIKMFNIGYDPNKLNYIYLKAISKIKVI